MDKQKRIQVISFQSLSANSGEGMARLGYYLSEQLHQRGLLNNFIVHSKGKFETPFPSKPVSIFSRYYLFLLNRLNKHLKIPSYKFRLLQEKLFDWFCQFRIQANTTHIFTTNAYLYRTFLKAKKSGITIILLPGTPEENYIYELVSEENKRLNITKVDAYTYRERIDFFNKSVRLIDTVIGSLPPAYTSYSKAGYHPRVVKMLGHMKPDFKPIQLTQKEITETFTIGYLAHTVVLKGLQYLLEAWRILTNNANNKHMHLSIAGSIDETIKEYIDLHFKDLKQVTFTGPIKDAPAYMQSLDLFVVPSLIDGAPVTALEAAHYAVPVIITDHSGSAELLSRNESGCWVIPIRDAKAIADKIEWAYNHREETRQMGRNAKHNLDTYSMESFITEIADYLEHKA
ncbi:MAG TPA: glycosyltransferase family 4 protein [Flavipsychrobacter sp.]